VLSHTVYLSETTSRKGNQYENRKEKFACVDHCGIRIQLPGRLDFIIALQQASTAAVCTAGNQLAIIKLNCTAI
jgi:hypothetical protein